MAFIYKITNEINDKCYIGKTHYSDPQRRWREHKREKHFSRPLYRAFEKYGVHNFLFQVIEETEMAEEREIYWIEFYKCYGKSGYNATRGGDGKPFLNHHEIINDYVGGKSTRAIAEINNCSISQVGNILRANKIPIRKNHNELKLKASRPVKMINAKSAVELFVFESRSDAARYLIKSNLSNISNYARLASQIGAVCKGARKTCCGFKWVDAD